MNKNDSRWIDISYPIEPGMAVYPGNPDFIVNRVRDIEKGDSVNISQIVMGSHTGTHIDAPRHFIEDGMCVSDIPLDWLNGSAMVIDATGFNSISVDFLKQYEIDEGMRLLFKTDNSNTENAGKILNDYCTLDYEAAEYLVEKQVRLVGIDYLSVERPKELRIKGKSVHVTLLEKNIIILEGLSLGAVSEGEYELHCLPLRFENGDGCPVRCSLARFHDGARFCDFFNRYRISMKDISSTIPFWQLPVYRKCFVVLFVITVIVGMTLMMFNQVKYACVTFILSVIFIAVFFILDSLKKNRRLMVEKYYEPYSCKRMRIVSELLNRYGINPCDIGTIDLLIEESKLAQSNCDYFKPILKPLKVIAAITGPVLLYAFKRIGDLFTLDDMIRSIVWIVVLSILSYSMLLVLDVFRKEVLYKDYNLYEELIYDLRQIKIFGTNDIKR
jgi:kynurenine formamidase